MSPYYFSKSHECFCVEGDIAQVSITAYAVDQLGEITFVQLPEAGKTLKQGESFGEIESVKTVSELYAPVSGSVIAINEALDTEPELINEDSLQLGWMMKLKLSDPNELDSCMDQAAYEEYIDQLS